MQGQINRMFLYNKTNRCINFSNLFWLKNESLRVSGSPSVHHHEFIHCTLGTGMSYRFEDSFRAGPAGSSILTLLGNGHQKPA